MALDKQRHGRNLTNELELDKSCLMQLSYTLQKRKAIFSLIYNYWKLNNFCWLGAAQKGLVSVYSRV